MKGRRWFYFLYSTINNKKNFALLTIAMYVTQLPKQELDTLNDRM